MDDFTLAGNNISYIPDDAFFGLTFYGANLKLSDNPIRSISKHAFRGTIGRITQIYLSDCELTEFPEKALMVFPYLSLIELQNNQLTEIRDGVFKHFLNLTTLSLGGNTIKNINRGGFFSGVEDVLENVELDSMNIRSFPSKALKNLKRLQRIDLSNNVITTLPGKMFKGFRSEMKRLQVLLGGNNMISISPDFIHESPIRLCWLNLTDNQLTTLDFVDVCSESFECDSPDNATILPSILVTQNPLKCDCELLKHLKPDTLQIVGQCDQPTMYRRLSLSLNHYQNSSEECPDFEPIICSSGLESSFTIFTMLTCLLVFSCTHINF